MNNKYLIIVSGEPYSVFSEIFFKNFKTKFYKNYEFPIILIGSKNLIKMQMKKLGYSFKINLINPNKIKNLNIDNKKINLIDVELNFKKPFGIISSKSSNYIHKCFEIGLNIMKQKIALGLINGPVSKKHLLKGKFKGITEYLASKTNTHDKEVMLIYNKSLSVCPITTHIPLKKVNQKISKEKILKKILTINKFYKKNLKKKPRFAITGLNPHCESILKNNEEDKIIKPAIIAAKKNGINIKGPFSADTIFTYNNRKYYDVIIGMYHDQVLAPIKTLFNFDAINITLGLPFIRISPDHGPNSSMQGKKISDSSSLREALKFFIKVNGN